MEIFLRKPGQMTAANPLTAAMQSTLKAWSEDTQLEGLLN